MTDAQDAREATLIYPGVCSLFLFQRDGKRGKDSRQFTLKVRNLTFLASNLVTRGVFTRFGAFSVERAAPVRGESARV